MLNRKVNENCIRHGAKQSDAGIPTSPKINLLNKHINEVAHLPVDWQFDESRALSFEVEKGAKALRSDIFWRSVRE